MGNITVMQHLDVMDITNNAFATHKFSVIVWLNTQVKCFNKSSLSPTP